MSDKLIRGFYQNGDYHKYGDRLYTTTGSNTDGSMTQKAVTDEFGYVEGKIILAPTTSDSAETSDIDVADNEGNVLARLQDGHFKVKNFDTKDASIIRNGDTGDLDISDEDGHVLMKLANGHIQTKNFSSAPLQGKKVSFIGDSITTFQGYPGSSHDFYKSTNVNITGVATVDDTWWMGLCNKQGATVNHIFAYGGGDIVGNLCLNYDKLFSEGTTGTAPDCIFILGGINDWGHGNTLGTIDDEPASDTTFYAAYKYLLDNLIETYPDAKIIALTMLNSMNHGTERPLINEGQLHSAFCKAIKDCCALYAVTCIDLNTLVNINGGNYTSLLADNTHPKKAGILKMIDTLNRNLTNIQI